MRQRRRTARQRNAGRRNAMRASVSRIGLRSSANMAFKNPYFRLLRKKRVGKW
jgi:hypothetical protein